jgi:4-amino-4-deoxy-L-arabinose transferase-like glycosyltransferase
LRERNIKKKTQRTWGDAINKFDKWRVLVLVFLIIFLIFLTINLDSMTVQWDEASHLDGGFLLLHGHLSSYMNIDSFYPPLDDLITASYFAVGGSSLFVGRLVSVTFVALTILAVFEFAYRTYDRRTAFVSAILLGTMPGIIWLGRVAMLDTILLFFFSASMMLFFFWLQRHETKYLILSGVTFGLGFLAKYPIIIAALAMLASILLIKGDSVKKRLSRFPYLLLTATIIVVPWLIVMYQTYSTGMLNQWLNVMNLHIPQNLNVPAPVFYLVAMVWPYGVLHPISIVVYALGLVGIGFLAWRRRPEDKFLLIWFFTSYVFFSFIGQMQWRYIVPVFPVIAMSAANLITSAFSKAEKNWGLSKVNVRRVRFGKIAAVGLIAVTVFAVAYSGLDAYNWVTTHDAYKLPLSDASQYVATRLNSSNSLVILFPINEFNSAAVNFYIYNANPNFQSQTWQYPNVAVDTYQFTFNVTELMNLCQTNHAKYLLLFEYGEDFPYFNSNLTMRSAFTELTNASRFALETSFGSFPQKIFVLSFT